MSRKFLGNSYDKNLKTSYKILDPIKRVRSSSAYGHDFWNAYEFTYLDKKNLPVPILKIIFIGLASLTFPHILLEYFLEKYEK